MNTDNLKKLIRVSSPKEVDMGTEITAELRIRAVIYLPRAEYVDREKVMTIAAQKAEQMVLQRIDDACGIGVGVRRMRSLMHRASEAYIHKTDVYRDWQALLAELDETPEMRAPEEPSEYVLFSQSVYEDLVAEAHDRGFKEAVKAFRQVVVPEALAALRKIEKESGS